MEQNTMPKKECLETMYFPNYNDSYIKNRLQGQVDYYHKACMRLQKEYNWLSILNIITTAVIPLFTLAIKDWDFAKYIVALLGALATIFTSILLLHKTKEKQINYRSTYENLKTEQIYYINNIEKYKDKNDTECHELFIETCENLMKNEHGAWKTLEEIEKI